MSDPVQEEHDPIKTMLARRQELVDECLRLERALKSFRVEDSTRGVVVIRKGTSREIRNILRERRDAIGALVAFDYINPRVPGDGRLPVEPESDEVWGVDLYGHPQIAEFAEKTRVEPLLIKVLVPMSLLRRLHEAWIILRYGRDTEDIINPAYKHD